MQTARTHLRRPGWRHQNHLHASPSGLVLHKLAQLVKRPGIMQTALGLSNAFVRPVADTLQVFQHDGPSSLLGRLHDMLADPMVHPTLVATFFARKPFQDTPCILARRGLARMCLRLKGSAHLVPFQSVGRRSRAVCRRWFVCCPYSQASRDVQPTQGKNGSHLRCDFHFLPPIHGWEEMKESL